MNEFIKTFEVGKDFDFEHFHDLENYSGYGGVDSIVIHELGIILCHVAIADEVEEVINEVRQAQMEEF